MEKFLLEFLQSLELSKAKVWHLAHNGDWHVVVDVKVFTSWFKIHAIRHQSGEWNVVEFETFEILKGDKRV